MPSITQERERLYRYAKRWGLRDARTLRQSQKVDKLINKIMVSDLRSRKHSHAQRKKQQM